MSRIVRRYAHALMLAVLAVTQAGCGGDDKPKVEGITQAEADDLMQALGSMAAINKGGWMQAIQSTLDAHPRDNRTALVFHPPTLTGGSVERDTIFTQGTIDWSYAYTYFDTLNTAHAAWDGSIRYLEGDSHARGPLTLADFNGSTGSGTFAFSDTMIADGYKDDAATPLEYQGQSGIDTIFVSITSGTSTRYYFMDNLVAYDVTMAKDPLLPKYPTTGSARVDTFIDVFADFGRFNRTKVLDVAMTIAFDGTKTPLASITAVTDPATTTYHYTVDLETGQIVRAP